MSLAYHGAVEAAEQAETLLRLAVAARRKLADIEEALGRLTAGTFGCCEQSGSAIPAGLLAVIPRSAAELTAVSAEIERAGGTVLAMACDVSDQQATAAAVTELARRLGPATLLINNAGISGPAGPLWEISPADWWRAFEVNIGGAFTLTRLLLPIGLSETALSSRAAPQTPQGRVHGWIRDQLRSGHGTDPAQATRFILALAGGCCHRLSGRYLTATDDLRPLLTELDRIERDDLHTLGLREV